jgi:uncharacterized peroxidase-related enzyme
MSVKNVFDSIKEDSTIIDVFMENQKRYMMMLSFAQEVLREASSLSPQDREIIAAYTSYLNGCRFCYGSHRLFAESINSEIEVLDSGIQSTSSRLTPIFNLVEQLTKHPSSMTKKLYDECYDAGFTQEQVKDAVAVCAAFNFFNRIVEGHGVQENSQSWAPAAEQINKVGYDQRY